MTNILELDADLRNFSGKAPTKLYRKKGQIPAIIYGPNRESIAVAVDEKQLSLAASKINFMSQPILLKMAEESLQIIPRMVQFHPVTDKIQHIDFMFADKDQPVKVKVALKFINRDKAPALKKGGKLNIILRSIDVLCKPEDSPSLITIDLSTFNVGEKLRETDLPLPKGVSLYTQKKVRTVLSIIGKNKESKEEEKVS